tara:strand:+ start:2988 stop:3884 length:897 start_codon:yes stop_codon:yes gene_type:complete
MNKFTSIDPNSLSTSELHKMLLLSVAPRPIALASTIDEKGNVNLSPFSCFNMFSANPPVLIFSPSRRVRDNSTKDTLENIKKVKEVVVNIVNFSIVEPVSLASTEYDSDVDEFKKSGLTPVKSKKITPPRVKESPISFECIVDKIIELGKDGGAGNLIISKIVYIHINNRYLDDDGSLDTKKLDLVGRMGASWYTRVIEESLFEIPKPIHRKGIGVDQLPDHLHSTDILTINNLARLGNIEKIPTQQEIKEYHLGDKDISQIMSISDKNQQMQEIHRLAKKQIIEANLDLAIKTVFSI